MKIYVVSHYYDNGESYEDYREYENHELYSTYQKAKDKFWASVVGDYEGKYVLTEWELDTQEKNTLEESAWIKCTSWYDKQSCCYEPDPEEYEYDPWEEYADSVDYNTEYACAEFESMKDEIKAEEEWLCHEGTNYQEWKECDEEIKKRKSDIFLDELNSMLVELLKQ